MSGTRFLAHVDRLFAYAMSLTRDRDQARDMVQECAVKVFAARRVPQDDAAFRAWLFKIARNAFIDRQRKAGAVAWLADEGEAGAAAVDWDVEDHLIDALTVRRGLEMLDPAQREIIALIDVVGLSYAEVAAVLDVPIGTVMSRITRARHALIAQIRDSNLRPFRAPGRTGVR